MTEEKYKRSDVDEQVSKDGEGHESVSVDKHCLDQSISNKVPYSVMDQKHWMNLYFDINMLVANWKH